MYRKGKQVGKLNKIVFKTKKNKGKNNIAFSNRNMSFICSGSKIMLA